MPNYFQVNPHPLFAAEFDYFRLPREKWELLLTRLQQMGATALFITLPWRFHQLNRRVVDLSGISNARRDVTGLLDLCAAFDLPCLLNIGPYAESGILGEGLPTWLPKRSDSPAETLPGQTRSWYKLLSKVLVERQWPDGPLIALQLNTKSDDGRATTPGKQLTEVKWPIWLRKRYHGIEALNAAYGAQYRTVSDVTFPESWADEATPLEKDAKTFLQEMDADTQIGYGDVLVEAGWQIPIYPSASQPSPDLPPIHTWPLSGAGAEFATWLSERLAAGQPLILSLRQPVQVEPEPADLGSGLAWAEQAPIREDGSLRRKFWLIRNALWPQHISTSTLEDGQLIISTGNSTLISCAGDRRLKIATTAEPKTPLYRLRLNGQLVVDANLKVARKKLSGLYQAEDDTSQTDWLLLAAAAAPLDPFPRTYLGKLLTGQAQALRHSAGLAEKLGRTLSQDQAETHEPEEPAQPAGATTYILGEARRGLREADAALRKAMASIGQLEGGFDTILAKEEADEVQPAAEPVAIHPGAFEGVARETLLQVGITCAELVEPLTAAAETLRKTVDQAGGLTLDQYQQNYTIAIAAAQKARQPLLDLIVKLRLDLSSEQLPLIFWRVHDQVQAIAAGLHWGVMRGTHLSESSNSSV